MLENMTTMTDPPESVVSRLNHVEVPENDPV